MNMGFWVRWSAAPGFKDVSYHLAVRPPFRERFAYAAFNCWCWHEGYRSEVPTITFYLCLMGMPNPPAHLATIKRVILEKGI